MSAKKKLKSEGRNIALCYVRQSWTRTPEDKDSPERQQANIQAVCDAHGWIPEWYTDAEGHKTGTKVSNRPGWLALEARLGDPDVVALVGNDLSRLHRKGWRIGNLLDFVDEHGVKLILAAPGKQMDFSTPQGRALAQMSAIFDEWYAIDISQRVKDMIAYRKRNGKTIGLPPFGTVRNEEGYLIPSPHGAWQLPNGKFFKGEQDQPPEEGSFWRGYYDAAYMVLTLYAQNIAGIDAIAYQMQTDGWAFRDRDGEPAPFEGADVRRIVANWAEYGGYVFAHRARERHPHDYDLDKISLIEERAVFPPKLLYKVGAVRRQRTIRRIGSYGLKPDAYPYPLQGLLRCAHCEQWAREQKNSKLRSRLGGHTSNDGKIHRYRHKPGAQCGCTNRSVKIEVVEHDFKRLLQLLTVDTSQIGLMTELSIQLTKLSEPPDMLDLEAQKRAAIATCNRRIDAAIVLFGDGKIAKEEYQRRIEQNEREIAHWEARTTDTEQIALELAVCIEAVDKIATLWELNDDEDKQGLVRSLFHYIVYDLDSQRIVDFRLKPWADRFITLRGRLYEDEDSSNEGDMPALCKADTNKLVRVTFVPSALNDSVQRILSMLYGFSFPENVKTRNEIIRERYASGEGLSELGRVFVCHLSECIRL
jgi:DNA invertase Pin-like site-specific DNA recombinase